MNTPELVSYLKSQYSLSSDQALADIIGVSGVTVMRWRKGLAFPSDEHLTYMLEISDLDRALYFAEIKSEEGQNHLIKATYQKLHKALAATATLIPALILSVHYCILCKIGLDENYSHWTRSQI